MSSLEVKIKDALKAAMIAKEELTLSVLRMLISAIQNKEISLRKSGEAELNDEQILAVIKTEVKKRKDSIESYVAGGRDDLAKKEKDEMVILEKYLPAQMDDETLEKIIKEVAIASEDKNFGKIMGEAMAKTKGLADGERVSVLVKKALTPDS